MSIETRLARYSEMAETANNRRTDGNIAVMLQAQAERLLQNRHKSGGVNLTYREARTMAGFVSEAGLRLLGR